MNNFSVLDSRNRRNLLAHSMNAFSPPFHRNYSTDTPGTDMKTSFGDSLFINTVHLIPEPVKLNLADSVVTLDEKKSKTAMAGECKVNNGYDTEKPHGRGDYYPSLAGIASFFSGVFSVMGGMFQKRANSPVPYYDCFEQGYDELHQMPPASRAWRGAKREDRNINGRARGDFADDTRSGVSADMSEEVRSAAAHCEDKLNRVRLLLSGAPAAGRSARARRPRRAFHDTGSAEELFEDAFSPEDFVSLANETLLDYCSPPNNHHEELHAVEAPKIKTETVPIKESMEIVQGIPPDCSELKSVEVDKVEDCVETKRQVVSSCEDKVSQLKALLQSRRSQKSNLNNSKLSVSTNNVIPLETSPIPIPKQSETESSTEVVFAKEIKVPVTPESPCVLEPSSYFDEVTGRFYSSSATDSEDSFQIVFSDSPRNRRTRIPSDCESEDSFIVFEESPDSCYTSNDVFGDDTNEATNMSDSDNSDSDCESDLDSGVSTMALSHTLTKTFGDLTDGSLYEECKSEDVVDCAFRSGSEIPREQIDADKVESTLEAHAQPGDGKRGLLLDDIRKREKKKLPEKKVHFSERPPRVRVMRVWSYAARQARAGPWERCALDRERFRRRIADVEVTISWVLKPQHRSRVMFQRFMPWWNAQRRKELAEKKQREEEEKARREKEEAEKLAAEEARLVGNDDSDRNDVDDEQVTVNSSVEDKDDLVEQLKNVQETIAGLKVNSEVNTCDTVDSGKVVKSDSARLDIVQVLDSRLGNATRLQPLQDEVNSDGELVDNARRIVATPDGDVNANCELNCDTDKAPLEDSNVLEEDIVNDNTLKVNNTHTGVIVKDDLQLNGDIALENKNVLNMNTDRAGQSEVFRIQQGQAS